MRDTLIPPAPQEPVIDESNPWLDVTAYGQVRAGDQITFKLGAATVRAEVAQVLCPGTPFEEIIYDGPKGLGIITEMVLLRHTAFTEVRVRPRTQAVLSNQQEQMLTAVGRRLLSQDNRCTDAPMFIVEQKRTYVTAEGYNDSRTEWVKNEGGERHVATAHQAARLEAHYRKHFECPKNWERLAVFDVWEFVTACFTEKGCEDYLRVNGHNLREPRIYAASSFRNHEFRGLREVLMAHAKGG